MYILHCFTGKKKDGKEKKKSKQESGEENENEGEKEEEKSKKKKVKIKDEVCKFHCQDILLRMTSKVVKISIHSFKIRGRGSDPVVEFKIANFSLYT